MQKVEIECKKLKLSAKSWIWVRKLEIKLTDRKVAKEKLTDGQSNFLFSKSRARPGWRNSWRNFYLIAWYTSVPSARPSRNFFINQHGEIFSCILLTGHQIIFLVQFEINKHSKIFSKTTNWTSPFCLSLKKFTCGYLFQIALEIIWLPILIVPSIRRWRIDFKISGLVVGELTRWRNDRLPYRWHFEVVVSY